MLDEFLAHYLNDIIDMSFKHIIKKKGRKKYTFLTRFVNEQNDI